MKRSIIIAMAASFALAACGTAEDKKKDPAPAETVDAAAKAKAVAPAQPKTEAQIKVEQKKVQQTVEQAMADIPPELREKHQAAFNCSIERNNKLPAGQQKEIGVDTIRSITAQLKANPNANACG